MHAMENHLAGHIREKAASGFHFVSAWNFRLAGRAAFVRFRRVSIRLLHAQLVRRK